MNDNEETASTNPIGAISDGPPVGTVDPDSIARRRALGWMLIWTGASGFVTGLLGETSPIAFIFQIAVWFAFLALLVGWWRACLLWGARV